MNPGETLVPFGPEFTVFRECGRDWFGQAVSPPVSFGFLVTEESLVFRAARAAKPLVHPEGRVGSFQSELWHYDVAEFFLSHPDEGRYLEVNLSPNGAWWSCLFRAPRIPLHEKNKPLEGIHTEATVAETKWEATLFLPLETLQKTIGFGEGWGLNATFIVDSPRQRFLSAHPLGSGEPDFHRPECFPKIRWA